jgi:hypothetical protein
MKVSEYLATLDGHGLYDVDVVVGKLMNCDTPIGYAASTDHLLYGLHTTKLYAQTPAQVVVEMAKDRRGGQLGPGFEAVHRSIAGYRLSRAIALLVLGESHGAALGRGSGFRRDVEELLKAGY